MTTVAMTFYLFLAYLVSTALVTIVALVILYLVVRENNKQERDK
jgi:hypothetical protein